MRGHKGAREVTMVNIDKGWIGLGQVGWGWVGLGQAEYLLLYYFTISGGMRGYKRARGVI